MLKVDDIKVVLFAGGFGFCTSEESFLRLNSMLVIDVMPCPLVYLRRVDLI